MINDKDGHGDRRAFQEEAVEANDKGGGVVAIDQQYGQHWSVQRYALNIRITLSRSHRNCTTFHCTNVRVHTTNE